MNKIIIREWDGDRSSAGGGFYVVLDENLFQDMGSFDNETERNNLLKKARAYAEKVSLKLGLPIEEDIYE